MTADPIAFHTLPRLGEIASPALESAIAEMVASKHACDALARSHDPLAEIAGDGLALWRDEYHTPEGFAFYRTVFPFVEQGGRDMGAPALVPARRTLGDAHQRYPEVMSKGQQAEIVAFLQHPDRSVWGNKECAAYTWIKPLGLFLAGEGKNRVSLFQRLGIEWIPACVSTEGYPSPDRIVMHTIKEGTLLQCWAVLDGRWAENVVRPAWILPVLRAYGVKVTSRWPMEFPALREVVRTQMEIEKDDFGHKPRIDLEAVKAREDWEGGWTRVSAWSRLNTRSSFKWAAFLSAAFVIGVLMMGAEWSSLRWLGTALACGSAGMFTALQIKLLSVRRRDVELPKGYGYWRREIETQFTVFGHGRAG